MTAERGACAAPEQACGRVMRTTPPERAWRESGIRRTKNAPADDHLIKSITAQPLSLPSGWRFYDAQAALFLL